MKLGKLERWLIGLAAAAVVYWLVVVPGANAMQGINIKGEWAQLEADFQRCAASGDWSDYHRPDDTSPENAGWNRALDIDRAELGLGPMPIRGR